MFDVTALGELLIDFTPSGKSVQGNNLYEANPGGAPCNVLAMLSRLNRRTAFIGKVGADSFGRGLKAALEDLSIDTDSLLMSAEELTTLAFVDLTENGERSFSFARKQSADTRLSSEELPVERIADSRIFHCGSLSLTDEPARSATFRALEIARQAGVCISVDPNLREPLWKDLDEAKDSMLKLLEYADILKISDYELSFLFGSADVLENMNALYQRFTPSILFGTCGEKGAYIKFGELVLHHRSYTEVDTIDTTGAGDGFLGAALHKLLEYRLEFERLSEEQCMDILQFASAAAAIVTTRRGALRSMPSDSEIMELVNKRQT